MIDTIYFLAMLIFFILLFKSAKHLMDNKKEVPAPQPIKQNTTHHHLKTSPAPKQKKRTYTSYANKVKKGKEYEEIIAKLFSCRGYTLFENGKNKGKKDGGIDLVASKANETILIQCKNWKSTSKYKIRHDEIKKLRAEGRDFLEEHKEYVAANMKLLFVLAEDCVHPSAKHHLEDIKNKGKKVDIEIIPIFNAEKEIKESLDIVIEDRKKCPKCNQGYLVPRTLKNKKYQGKYKQENFLGCSRFPKCKYSEDIV
ncbi:MAG: restriction endonuclease [Candidatus Desulfofervidus auxilii]|nr:restriction endonuclease [Candidatus Desulfofervidus auxilii]